MGRPAELADRLDPLQPVPALDQRFGVAREAASALKAAANRTQRQLFVDHRDLFRRPLDAKELGRFESIVLDPPRAGAEAQARQLARSAVPVVASVSCDAGTFARDAAILIDGGYALTRVTPVDQFKESAHVELVGLFRRPSKTTRKRLRPAEPVPAGPVAS